jgi:purine-binding chemotaxis protein CheW
MKEENSPMEGQQEIDWDGIQTRLEAAVVKIEQGWTPGLEETARILRDRARALAREDKREEGGDRIEFVEFTLAYERYGIGTAYVREVYPLKDFTPVPCMPGHVMGIINVRGQIVSIVDLMKFFDLPDKGLGELNKVIILQSDNMEFGVLADVIVGVREVPAAGLQPSLPTLTGIREEYLLGITEDRTVVLDARRILADEKIVVNEEVF